MVIWFHFRELTRRPSNIISYIKIKYESFTLCCVDISCMNTVVTHTSSLIQYNEERGDLISSVLDAVLSLNGFHQPTRLVHLVVFGRSSSFGNIRPLETCRASSSSSEGSVFDERAIRGLVYDFWEDSLSAQQEANVQSLFVPLCLHLRLRDVVNEEE